MNPRAPARLGFGAYVAAVQLDDLAAECQAQTGAGVLILGMQAVENLEDALLMFGLHADAVVDHADLPPVLLALGKNLDFRGLPGRLNLMPLANRFWNTCTSNERSASMMGMSAT